MISMRQVTSILDTAILFILAVALGCKSHIPNKLNVFGSPVNENTAVRLFFNSGNHFNPPLIFRAVAKNDHRLNTAPMLVEGRTVFITVSEMQSLLQGLNKMGLSWKESKEQMTFGDATKIIPTYSLSIVVVSSDGTAESGFDPAKICQSLAPLDSALSTPRALWEFQIFRAEYNCSVPGLNGQSYPDHWPWNAAPTTEH